MNFMPAADSRVFMFGHVDVYEIEYRFEYRNEYGVGSRFGFFFYVWAYGWCRRSNIDLSIEMNFMPAADSHFLMYGHMDVKEIESRFEYRNEFHASSRSRFLMYRHVEVYEIQYRFEYRNEFHASSRFAIFYVWEYGRCI